MLSSPGKRFVHASDGNRLYCEIYGNGAPVLLCDGLACDGFIWKYVISELAVRYQLIHWHYPGHGHSDVPTESAASSIERLADDLKRVVTDTIRQPAVILGHSLGVQVALEAWHRYPQDVKALVLVCGVSGHLVASVHRRSLLRYLLPLLTFAESSAPTAIWSLLRKLPSSLLTKAAILAQAINTRLIRTPDLEAYFNGLKSADIRFALRLLSDAARHDTTSFLSRIDVPVLIIGGGLDTVAPPFRLREIASQIPNAEVMIARRGSHALPVEQPDLIALRVRQFLDERVFGDVRFDDVTGGGASPRNTSSDEASVNL